MTCAHNHSVKNCGECLGRTIDSQQRVVGSKGIDSPPPLKKETQISTEQANAVRRLVTALARDDADREQLLDAPGLTEVPA